MFLYGGSYESFALHNGSRVDGWQRHGAEGLNDSLGRVEIAKFKK